MVTLQQQEEWEAEDREAEDDLLALEAKSSANLINIDFVEVRSLKPSGLLRAMLEGLAEQSADPAFRVDMLDYGTRAGEVCFGCAATCTIAKLNGALYSSTAAAIGYSGQYSSLARRLKGTSYSGDVRELEWAIDAARQGFLLELFEFCKIDASWDPVFDCRFCLETHNWEERIPAVEATIAALKEAGF